MILVRAWRRQLLGGLGAALIVPTTLLAALALLALAGGFAGLGALGQAFSGPSLPAAERTSTPGTRSGRAISTVLLAALSAPAPASGTGHAPAGNGPAGAGGRPSLPATPRSRPGGSAVGPVARQPSPATQPPSPPPATHPTLTDQVVGAGTSVTGQLPAPVGPAASGALQSAGTTVDQVFPIPAPAPPQLP
ncbi:MAG TPA: hypothetical protein VMP89_13485 [Solirubrobacteraceae bacterium]|nr:hypothetical protein [Solirubrobacteraceae bacterium]